jgi:two-component system sensor histidine kinase YesM
MIQTIKTLIENHYQHQIKLQAAEFQALENQIKPHFLYNTLDVIKFRALRSGAPELASNLEDMARYFRLVLARGRDSLTLLDETEHCRLYVKLHNFRHEAEVVLETEIPEDTAFAVLPRFMLQPLVENALVHGIRPKSGRSGRIVIRAFRQGGDIRIRVIDDGAGIPLEILAVLPEDGGKGFGLFNVHTRIRLLYGSEYGLFFPWSGKDGTCAELRLPYKPDENYLESDIDPAELEPHD